LRRRPSCWTYGRCWGYCGRGWVAGVGWGGR